MLCHSYYESIQISSGGGFYSHATSSPAAFSPTLLVAAGAALAYAAVASAFLARFSDTTYAPGKRWQLALLWPFLVVFSSSFRQQLWQALTGKQQQ